MKEVMTQKEQELKRIIDFAIVDLTSPNMHHKGYISSGWIYGIVKQMEEDLERVFD